MRWELSLPVTVALLAVYALVMAALTWRQMRRTDAEEFVVADRDVGRWRGVATMSATWIWAASLYAAATAAWTYGLAGAFHYAPWGGLALLFVRRYGLRVRRLTPPDTHCRSSSAYATAGCPRASSVWRTTSTRSTAGSSTSPPARPCWRWCRRCRTRWRSSSSRPSSSATRWSAASAPPSSPMSPR